MATRFLRLAFFFAAAMFLSETALAAPKGSIKVNADNYFESGGVSCAKKGAAWVPGTLIASDLFLPHSVKIKKLKEAAAEKSGAAQAKLLKKIKRLKSRKKAESVVCAAGPQLDQDTLGPSAADSALLEEAGAHYLALQQSLPADQVIPRLLEELSAIDGIVSAELAADGYNVVLTFADGSSAWLNTFTAEGPAAAPSAPPDIGPRAAGESAELSALTEMLAARALCSAMVYPPSQKVLIVHMSSVTNPHTVSARTALKDALLKLGWNESDIVVRAREAQDDMRLTPDSLFDVRGFGVVIYVGHGGHSLESDGIDHFFMQCCSSGKYGTHVPEARKVLFRSLLKQDKIIGWTMLTNPGGKSVMDLLIRDDVFKSELKADPGAMILISSCHGWMLREAFAAVHPGSFGSWEEKTDLYGDQLLIGRLFTEMRGTQSSRSDAEALGALQQLGQDKNVFEGQLKLAEISGDFFLPAWGTFSAPRGELPPQASKVEGRVSYLSCSAKNFTLTLAPGASEEVSTLVPQAARIMTYAYSSAGKLLGTGLENKTFLSGGKNDVNLKTCTADVLISTGQIPVDGANTASKILTTLTWDDAELSAPAPIEFAPPGPGVFHQLPVGGATLAFTAKNAGGESLGQNQFSGEIQCGENEITACFGWAKFTLKETPPGTAKVRITKDSAPAGEPLLIPVGGSGRMYGFRVGGSVEFTAAALDSSDQTIVSSKLSTAIACGENALTVSLFDYGLLLEAQPDAIRADGVETAALTATAKKWKSGDTAAPSGAPVPGLSISFGASAGELVGGNPAVTDAKGQAAIKLRGTVDSLSRVTAFVEADNKEKQVVVQIGEPYLIRFLSRQAYNYTDAQNHEQICVTGFMYMLFQPKSGTTSFDLTLHRNGFDPAPGLPLWPYRAPYPDGFTDNLSVAGDLLSYSQALAEYGTLTSGMGMQSTQYLYAMNNCGYCGQKDMGFTLDMVLASYDSGCAANWNTYVGSAVKWAVDVTPRQ